MKRKFEALPPVTYEAELEKRKIQLEKIIKSKQNTINEKSQLKNAGKIRIVPHKNTMQFYLITKKNDTTGKYLPRKLLIDPVTLPDKNYETLWQSQKSAGNDFFNSPEFFTANGEKVRSKSEVIIADTLSRMKIPYKYEMSLELKDGKTIYPDFCCLNLRTRQEVYWEHFGLMDDPDYISKTISKIQSIQESGYNLGENFIFTMEKSELPLNPKFVQTMVEKYLA